MRIPYSDMPPDVVQRHLMTAFQSLSEASMFAMKIDLAEHSDELAKLCEIALILTMAAKDVLDGRLEEANTRIDAALQDLPSVQSGLIN